MVERDHAIADLIKRVPRTPLKCVQLLEGMDMRVILSALTLAFSLSLGVAEATAGEPFHVIPGAVPSGKGPDGNTVIFDAPDGLIVVDTGRHPEHAQKILDFAKQRGRPIAAIVNSHWHMDHTTGNADIRAVYPAAQVYQSNAVHGALETFLADSRKGAEEQLRDPSTPNHRIAEIKRFLDRMDDPQKIKPTKPVTASGRMAIAGRSFDVHLAKFAASEGDVWLYDPQARVAVVGDLVVDIVPFMDTACPDGWAKALDEIEAKPFTSLIPGHGSVMDRADFLQWKSAYQNFVQCGRSDAPVDQCVEGWSRDAGKFIDSTHRVYARKAAAYYLNSRLRSSPEEQQKFCAPLKA